METQFLIFPLTDLKVDTRSKNHLSLLHIWPYFSNVICFGTSTSLLTERESFYSVARATGSKTKRESTEFPAFKTAMNNNLAVDSKKYWN